MKILLGIINSGTDELLFILDNGKPMLIKKEGNISNDFANFPLLRQKVLKINDRPIKGSGVFKFRYGPVANGVGEAGCFYLYTYGEKILRTTIDIGWKQREIVKAMQQLPIEKAIPMSERICSNFAMSHSVAFTRAVEMALGITPAFSTRNWRILFVESERVYNHLHVIYKLADAAAQKVLAAHLSALFEDALRLNQALSGSRYLMGINNIGKLNKTPELSKIQKIAEGYRLIMEKFIQLYNKSLNNNNYLDRLHSVGILTAQQAKKYGLTGPSLRACGTSDDLNENAQHLIHLPTITKNEGDALARMEIRAEEIVNSCQYLIDHLRVSDTWLDKDEERIQFKKDGGTGYAVTNSPSGAIAYYLQIDERKVQNINIFTSSYPGMYAVSYALEGQILTDFPFVVDSFGIHFADAAC